MCSTSLAAQTVADSLDRVYGPDPVLVNGKKYTFRGPPGSSGHPYLLGSLFYKGEAVIRGKTYSGLRLNIDIVNQQVLLNYEESPGRMNVISLNTAWLESFAVAGKEFVVVRPATEDDRIMQQLGTGSCRILVAWWKTLKPGEAFGSLSYKFSDPKRQLYLWNGKEMKAFRNNGSFLRLFPEANRDDIRRYMRQQGMKIRKLPDEQLTALIDQVSQITGK